MTKKELVALLSGVDDKAEVLVCEEDVGTYDVTEFTYDLSENEVFLKCRIER